MKLRSVSCLLVFCPLLLPRIAAAQQTSFADVANGATAPASLKIGALTPDYKPMRIHSAGEASQGLIGSLGGIMMMAGMGGNGQNASKIMPAFFQLSGLSDMVWTKGQTVSLAGHEFLVAYRLNTGIDPAAVGGSTPRLAADLTLNLIRTDTVISIAPDPNMTPDQLRKTLASAGASVDTAPLHMQTSSDEMTTAAILFPVFAQARVSAQETVALSNLKQIALSAIMYTNDNDDVFPYVQSTEQFRRATSVYINNQELWKDPNPKGGGFRFAMNLAGVKSTAIDDISNAPLLYEENAWPDGRRAVAFADGHAKRISLSDWPMIELNLHKKYPRAAKAPIKFN